MRKILYVSCTIYCSYLHFRNYPLGFPINNHHPCPCHPENTRSKNKKSNFFGFPWGFCMDFLGNQTRMNFLGNWMGDGFCWGSNGDFFFASATITTAVNDRESCWLPSSMATSHAFFPPALVLHHCHRLLLSWWCRKGRKERKRGKGKRERGRLPTEERCECRSVMT